LIKNDPIKILPIKNRPRATRLAAVSGYGFLIAYGKLQRFAAASAMIVASP